MNKTENRDFVSIFSGKRLINNVLMVTIHNLHRYNRFSSPRVSPNTLLYKDISKMRAREVFPLNRICATWKLGTRILEQVPRSSITRESGERVREERPEPGWRGRVEEEEEEEQVFIATVKGRYGPQSPYTQRRRGRMRKQIREWWRARREKMMHDMREIEKLNGRTNQGAAG